MPRPLPEFRRVHGLFRDFDHFAGGENLAILEFDEFRLVRRQEIARRLAEHLVAAEAGHPLAFAVHADVAQRARVLDEHHDGQALEQRIEKSVHAPQIVLGLFHLADVARDREQALRPPVRAHDGHHDHVPPFGRALDRGAETLEASDDAGAGAVQRLLGGGAVAPFPDFHPVRILDGGEVVDVHERKGMGRHPPQSAVEIQDAEAVGR